MAVRGSETDDAIEASIQSGPNGERGIMCYLSAEQLAQLGISNDAESVSYYIKDGSLVVEE